MATPGFTFKQLIKNPSFESVFKFLGDNPNSAVLVACAIATFKGIFRPMFTMMDKESDPETKKYAAIREGLTELIAIPIYIAIPALLEKLVINKVFKNETHAQQKVIKTNAKFLAVCASTAIIPAVCNLLQPPIMAAYKKKQAEKAQFMQANNIPAPLAPNKPAFSGQIPVRSNPVAKTNYGMRVGS